MQADKVRGMLWGAVCGSALGLPFLGRDPEVCPQWPDKASEEAFVAKRAAAFRDRPSTSHGKHPTGSWSGILDPLLLALKTLVELPQVMVDPQVPNAGHRGIVLEFVAKYSHELRKWSLDGLAELNDPNSPYELDFYTRSVVSLPGYLERPLLVATQFVGHNPNDCAALLRVLAAAIMPSAAAAERLALLTCCITHKSKSVAACGCFIVLVLQGLLFDTPERRHLVVYACSRLEHLVQGLDRSRIYKTISEDKLQDVGGRDYAGRHLASVRCFMFALRQVLAADALPQDKTPLPQDNTPLPQDNTPLPQDNTPLPQDKTPLPQDKTLPLLWERTLSTVCVKGGSADVNGALAGAVLGARYGSAVLPPWKDELPHAKWLDHLIEDAVRTVCL